MILGPLQKQERNVTLKLKVCVPKNSAMETVSGVMCCPSSCPSHHSYEKLQTMPISRIL